jgi:hypothetical protein
MSTNVKIRLDTSREARQTTQNRDNGKSGGR